MGKNFFSDKTIIVTGGAGFLGSSLVPMLESRGADVHVPRSKDCDLRVQDDVNALYDDVSPDIVIHMAVNGGGIGYTRKHPGSVFYDNLLMGVNTIHSAMERKIGKYVGIGTICAYPKFTKVPFREEDLWEGYPEETNASYGLSKKMMLVQSQAYRQEYGFNGIHLLLVNMYGPNDDFDLQRSHVIPALIRKFVNGKENGKDVVVWGSGKPSREFLYVDDAARAIMLATERYNKPEPVNIGAGQEITIMDLVKLLVELTGYEGCIMWDDSKPDGQPRRCLDTSRAKEEFGFEAKVKLRDGLKKTIEWYKKEWKK